MKSTLDASPRLMARMIGVFYLLLLAGGLDQYVFAKLVVRSDAALTAANIHAHESLFLAGFASAALAVVLYLAVTALFYKLFKRRPWSFISSRCCSWTNRRTSARLHPAKCKRLR